MPNTDVFAHGNSTLNAFLFAEVGNELNGSPLTVLSVLARLGWDPWIEATRWSKLTKGAGIEILTESISQMPLCKQALVDARVTASRLIPLLPATIRTSSAANTVLPMPLSKAHRVLRVAFYCVLAVGVAINFIALSPSQETPIVQDQSATPHNPVADHPAR